MFKYSVAANAQDASFNHKVNDLDLALHLFINNYRSGLFDSVDFTDATTGEVLAYFRKEHRELWHADAIIDHMIGAICRRGQASELASIFRS